MGISGTSKAVPAWLVTAAIIGILLIGAYAVYSGGTFKVRFKGGSAEIKGHVQEQVNSAETTVNTVAIRDSISDLIRLESTLKLNTDPFPLGGRLMVFHKVGSKARVTYSCPPLSPCPAGTVAQAVRELLSPATFVQQPNHIGAMLSPGFNRYLLLGAWLVGQFETTSEAREAGLVDTSAKGVSSILSRARAGCNLDPSAVDTTIQRVVRIRGLEDNSAFWVGDPGAPAPLTRWHLDDNPLRPGNHSKLPMFGHFLIEVSEASGLTASQSSESTVADVTELVAAEYLKSSDSIQRFIGACRAQILGR